MKKINQIAVYAASSELVADHFFSAARAVGEALAKAEIRVIYGGGATGLMGALADSVLEHNGHIKGIIPQFMIEVEWQHEGLSELEVVEHMYERKNNCLKGTEAILALPGGSGTLEELLEVITLKRLGLFKGPIVILNLKGYYDPLITMLNRCISEKFMKEDHQQIWTVIKEPSELIEVLHNGHNWNISSLKEIKMSR